MPHRPTLPRGAAPSSAKGPGRCRRPAAAVAAAVLALAALAAGPATAGDVTPHPEARRIVSVGGAVTEILFALGAGDRIAAVDSTSLHPDAVRDLPVVGYMRQLAPEGVLSVGPDLILAIEGSGPPPALAILQAGSVPVELVPDVPTPAGVAGKIRAVGAAIGREAAAEPLAAAVEAEFAALARETAALPEAGRKRVLFVLSLANGRVMAGGRGTAAEAIVTLAGGINAADFDGYKPMVDEAVIAAAPDVVLAMRRGDHETSAAEVFALPAFRATPAAEHGAFLAMDGGYLLGFGPRAPAAARELATRLYPDRIGAP
ncbi:heme/hemin ABC transporter substrate-binding protein [Methylobrevis pamukkalensis]|uniref:Hemin-binding periplasmic protein HmuT n=1 Tax=Methylobrevis pamukkalensis TaxID=1439726 RepID=A0A1E3H409_9HYPH|nr:ABC transporter substrate-binding protein [Methylobrevis pamukkalensis]ODN71087.1 Hemin-binding periplasmic protein HmuT precursor [Methylobrevis pamukkalensis]